MAASACDKVWDVFSVALGKNVEKFSAPKPVFSN